MSDQETPLIELRDVHKSFGDNHVFRGLSLKLHRGESLVLIGSSASGKTLMMKTILGLVEPDSGTVLIDGQDTTHMKDKARSRLYERFGMLFQQSALFDSLPVWRNVAFRVLQQEGVTPIQAREVAVDKLASVGWTRMSAISIRPNCRAECRNESVSRAPSRRHRKSCCWTSRRRASTRS